MEAWTRHDWGRVLARAGDAGAARERFTEALDLYHSLRASPDLIGLVEADLAAL